MLLVSLVRWHAGQGDMWSHILGAFAPLNFGAQLWRLVSWVPYIAMAERRHLLWITPGSLETRLNFYPPRESWKEKQTYAKNEGKKWQWRVCSWSQPSSLPSPGALLRVGWVISTVLQIYLGKCLCMCCSAGIRAPDECRDRRTKDPRGLKGQAHHSGSLESPKLWNQVFLASPEPFLPIPEQGNFAKLSFPHQIPWDFVCRAGQPDQRAGISSPLLSNQKAVWLAAQWALTPHPGLPTHDFLSCVTPFPVIQLAMFASYQKIHFLDLLFPEPGLLITASPKIKIDYPYRGTTRGGLESSIITRTP